MRTRYHLAISVVLLGLALPVTAADWLPTLQLQYALQGRWMGLPLRGDGRFVWSRLGDDYTVELSASSLLDASYRSSGRIDGDWLQPQRYTQQLFIRTTRIDFDRQHRLLRLAAGTAPQPLVAHLQDSASVFAQFTHLVGARNDWQPGANIDVMLARPSGITRWRFTLIDVPLLQTGVGPLRCLHWQVRTEQDEPGDQVWLAPRLHQLPVRIRLLQGSDALQFDLQAASLPLEAVPDVPNSRP